MTEDEPAAEPATDPARVEPRVERWAAIAAQGLDGTVGEDLEELVARTGFVRTLGGADVYLALRARRPGLQRTEVDAAIERGALRVVPAVRGCIYVVAERHVALALHVAESLARSRTARELKKVGVAAEELDEVQTAIVEVLGARGAMTTQGLRKALPAGAVRSLGEVGKRVGISSTLPPALRRLEFAGRVERSPEGARLDHERYLWRLPDTNPLERGNRPEDDADAHRQLADLFFRSAGVGTVAEFADWSGLGLRESAAALADLSLEAVRLEDVGTPGYALPDLLDDGERLAAARGAVALLPCADNLVALRGGPRRMVDPRHHDRPCPVWGRGRGSTLGDVKHSFARTVVADGRIVGLWEYDPDAEAVALGVFDREGVDGAAVRAEAEAAAAFLRDGLGHGRALVTETDDALRERVALVTSGA